MPGAPCGTPLPWPWPEVCHALPHRHDHEEPAGDYLFASPTTPRQGCPMTGTTKPKLSGPLSSLPPRIGPIPSRTSRMLCGKVHGSDERINRLLNLPAERIAPSWASAMAPWSSKRCSRRWPMITYYPPKRSGRT